mgnify:FL=1
MPLYKSDYNPYLFFSIPAFLTFYQLGVILFIHKYIAGDINQSTHFMYLSKIFKVLASVVFILICYKIVGLDTLLLLIFLTYYMLFIAFDSWLFIRCNREYQKELIKQKGDEEDQTI